MPTKRQIQKQIAANSINLKKSAAARLATEAMLVKTMVLKTESKERFCEILQQLKTEFQPEGPAETILVHNMIVAQWRLLRLRNMEAAGTGHEVIDQLRFLDLIDRSEARLDRQFFRALASLTALRRTKARIQAAREKAAAALFAYPNPIPAFAESHKSTQVDDSKCA